jgi:hypothetical protein
VPWLQQTLEPCELLLRTAVHQRERCQSEVVHDATVFGEDEGMDLDTNAAWQGRTIDIGTGAAAVSA